MTSINSAHLHCPHCGELAPQRIVRQRGEEPLLWCGVCHRVTIVEHDLSLPINPLPFSPTMSVQIASLDADHERLIGILNDLHAAAKAGHRDRLLAVSNQLLGDLAQHFQREELLLETWNFPELTKHQSQHATLLKEVRRAIERLLLATHEVDDVVRSVKFYLIGHLTEDMKYKDHLSRTKT